MVKSSILSLPLQPGSFQVIFSICLTLQIIITSARHINNPQASWPSGNLKTTIIQYQNLPIQFLKFYCLIKSTNEILVVNFPTTAKQLKRLVKLKSHRTGHCRFNNDNNNKSTLTRWQCFLFFLAAPLTYQLFNDLVSHFNLASRSSPPRPNHKATTHLIPSSISYVRLLDVLPGFDIKCQEPMGRIHP